MIVSSAPAFRALNYRVSYNEKTTLFRVEKLIDVCDPSGELQWAPLEGYFDSLKCADRRIEYLERIDELVYGEWKPV